jgi:hypothetical protein
MTKTMGPDAGRPYLGGREGVSTSPHVYADSHPVLTVSK